MNNEQYRWACKNASVNFWAQGWMGGVRGRKNCQKICVVSFLGDRVAVTEMESVACGFWFRDKLPVAKASKPPAASSPRRDLYFT